MPQERRTPGISEANAVLPANADLTNVSGFKVGVAGDVIDFGANSGLNHSGIWGSGGGNGSGGTALGLLEGNGTTFVGTFGGTDFVIQQVPTATTELAANTNVIALIGNTFGTAGAVVAALADDTIDIDLNGAGIANNNSGHMIVAWQDFAGNTHLSDLAFINKTGAVQDDFSDFNLFMSDMVQLTGVQLTSLDVSNIQFV